MTHQSGLTFQTCSYLSLRFTLIYFIDLVLKLYFKNTKQTVLTILGFLLDVANLS